MIFNARNAAFFAPELTLLVAAGEQEDLCPFFASRHHGALAFLVPKRLPYGTESSLGSDVLGGSRRVDGLRAVFLLVACCYQEGAGPAPEHQGQPFIAMELLDGQTLKHRIGGKPLQMDELLDWGGQIAGAW